MRNHLKVGLVQVYTGNGKGKTTAALGLALRASGHHFKVLVVQFMKGASYAGELFAIERLYPDVKIMQFGRGCRNASLIREGLLECQACGECFVKAGEERPEDALAARLALDTAIGAIQGGEYDIVVMDEISQAIGHGLVDTPEVLNLIRNKPRHIEIVLTGRDMPQEILKAADLVTEMRDIAHPFAKGIGARRGIEY
ncbi:MAG TPA: cob(I)yrinic acid a,c-diamide adenosyltransferase [Firmicutes bacterium]|nr:cob(I)yrinic acid a,c-diamide adenosyltransferase [Bacillota bacterium]